MEQEPKTDDRGPREAEAVRQIRFLTREELAEVLQVSIRTVDAMIAGDEIPCVRLREAVVRFYLPDVVRHLTATAVISKRGCARRISREVES
jgi:excisionase family DNA binding protein